MKESDSGGVISLGADVGGSDAQEVTHPHILELRRLLSATCRGPYSDALDKIALVLRIDGSVQSWGKAGVEGVVVRKEQKYATADVFIPQEAWSGDERNFRRILASEVITAVLLIAERAASKGVCLAHEQLERDVRSAAAGFIAD